MAETKDKTTQSSANTPSDKTYKIVFVRHGESQWNQENRFTGWTDVDLAPKGREEAKAAGKTLKTKGFTFDVAFTSVLTRAIHTLWEILDATELVWIPVHRSWRLNERHYGALQGLNKTETAQKHGEDMVKIWRRSFDTPPPFLDKNDPRHPVNDPRYKGVEPNALPSGEALKNTAERVLPYWQDQIVPQILAGKNVLVVAHGNSIRALIQYLDQMTPAEIMEVNVPTGTPLVYELDKNLKKIKSYYVGDEEAIKKAMESVANQGKSKK